jgi:hypothetical protein
LKFKRLLEAKLWRRSKTVSLYRPPSVHRFGFTERMDSSAALSRALDSLKRQNILP